MTPCHVPAQFPVFVAIQVGQKMVLVEDHTIGRRAVTEALVNPPKLLVEVVMYPTVFKKVIVPVGLTSMFELEVYLRRLRKS